MTKRMTRFVPASLVGTAILVATAGCGVEGASKGASDASAPPATTALAAYTLSYRSGVRVPSDGTIMSFDDFAAQVSRLDPLAAKRCPVTRDAELQAAVDALGGITWTHPVEILKDQSLPPLYRGHIPPQSFFPPAATAGASDSAPTIERPDLVGYQGNIAIFLSQVYGLLAVKTDGPAPVLSCALSLPGQPKYFFYHGNELVLLVNGLSAREAALLRFAVSSTGFTFVDAVMLDNQQILDARLFDSTLVIYASTSTPPAPSSSLPSLDGGVATGGPSSGGTAGPALPVSVIGQTTATTGVKVTAVKWDTALTVAWSEEFPNDHPVSDPLAGQNPVDAAKLLSVGDVVATARTYKSFISASDGYFVVSRDVDRTVFTGTQSQTYTYCAASHPGPEQTFTYCTPTYEQRPNPDYKDPQSTKGDYPCNGKTLLDCIQEAAPTVSRYIYVRTGQTCNTYSYHDYICDRNETQTVSYPTYRTDSSTQFVVYRYANGDFVKLDQQLYEMASPGTTTGSVPTLTFSGQPLEVSGSIDQKGDLQFQHGQFYVLTNQGQVLHTLLIAGNSVAELGTLNTPRAGGSYSYSGDHATLFSDTRMMVSRAYYDSSAPKGIYQWSDVLMLDLGVPSFPSAIEEFVMPGSSAQLILASSGILGPGTVSFTSGGVQRNLEKITLFSQNDASEIDNVLLGTEYNASFVSTWFATDDDQRIRLDDGSQRLFLPYGGYLDAPQSAFNPAAHRLNITAVGAGTGLASEMTFDLVEDIVRTVSIDSSPTAGHALAFGNSSIYGLDQGDQGWSLDVLEEIATPMAVYRLSDTGDLHARIDRVGARCFVSTFQGSANAFTSTPLATGPRIACPETGMPVAVGLQVVFSDSSTGWGLSSDGLTITSLGAADVKDALTHIRSDVYCALDGSTQNGTPVPYLDAVPSTVQCFDWQSGNPLGGPTDTISPGK